MKDTEYIVQLICPKEVINVKCTNYSFSHVLGACIGWCKNDISDDLITFYPAAKIKCIREFTLEEFKELFGKSLNSFIEYRV
jgi:hypothetical protein